MSSRFRLFSDPVHGFVSVPKRLVPLIETPEFQRLRRIRQLGLGHLVFPGAEHTRFAHALGAMALLHEALATLSDKGTPISEAEHEAALAAALLHDVGHGPFSHTLEEQLIAPGADGTPHHHERMSRAILVRLNARFGGALDRTLAIFDGTYERPFFHQLLASQLDMDRLDYLRRDSFHTGVAEGVVGVERIIKTLRVHPTEGGPDAEVVVEAKGAFAVESFLLSRRLMYWQVYLHKTVTAADHLLRAAFARARAQLAAGDPATANTTPALRFFLERTVTADQSAHDDVLDAFCALDDTDIYASMKAWTRSADRPLADLARRFLDRDLFRTTYLPRPLEPDERTALLARTADWLARQGIAPPDEADAVARLYVATGTDRLDAYTDRKQAICILERDGRVRKLSEADGVTAIGRLAGPVERHYVCAPKPIEVPQPLPRPRLVPQRTAADTPAPPTAPP